MPPTVVMVRTGIANTASVQAALERLGAAVRLSSEPSEVAAAEAVVLPGVGAFAAGMDALEEAGLVATLRERMAAGRRTLAVCLGLQLLAEGSDEAPGRAGIGLLPGIARRLPEDRRLPRIGWNPVHADSGEGALRSGVAYFAHSYALREVPAGWRALRARWDEEPYVAALEKGEVMACQFHPELSGQWGRRLLAAWLTGQADLQDGAAPPVGEPRRIIPCLDVRGGRVVKGVKFQGLRDAGDPASLAAAYEAQGADELVVLDVSATPEQRDTAVETVRRVRAELSIPLTVGGGVRSVAHAERLLAAGADKVGVNTAAFEDPALLTALAERFGRQCVVLALDARRTDSGWEVVVRSGTEGTGKDAIAWAREAVARGAGEILLTSWDRDGTHEGYDVELLQAITAAVRVPVIASGGASGAPHMAAAVAAGADAVLAASIFHDAQMTVGDVKRELAELDVEVRR